MAAASTPVNILISDAYLSPSLIPGLNPSAEPMTEPEADPKLETSLLSKIVPARSAAQKAAASLKPQNTRRPRTSAAFVRNALDEDSDPADDAGDEHEETKTSMSSGRRRSDVMGSRGRGRGRGWGRGRGQAQRRSGADGDDHEGTTRSPSPFISQDLIRTPLKRPRPSTSSTPSKRTKTTTPTRKTKSSAKFLAPPTPQLSGSEDKHGSFHTEGDVVWVRLNSRGKAMDPREDVELGSYWWPAQVTDDKGLQIELKLFGNDGHGQSRVLNASWLSSSTILTFRHGDHIRFSSDNFALTKSLEPSGDPKMREIEGSRLLSRWKVAFDLALSNDIEDELLDPHAAVVSAGGKGKEKAEKRGISEGPITPPNRSQRPPPPPLDEEIKVGKEDGELVLARDHKDRPDHWPARVIGISRNSRTGIWLYEVRFIDGKRKKMERKWFFSSEEAGFATCQLGMWDTKFPASDTEGTASEDEFIRRNAARSSSPSPSESDLEEITDFEKFGTIPLREQMSYVFPFLCRIIRRQYQPSFDRHDAFMKGGKAREYLGQKASLRGEFSDNEMKKVLSLVRKVMLRNERWAERVYDDENPRNDEESHTIQLFNGAKLESVGGSVGAQSPELDAAMALAELKSSEESTLYPSPTPPTRALESIKAQTSPPMSPANNFTSDGLALSTEPPPSSMISFGTIDNSSDMEIESDEENHLTPTQPAGLGSESKVFKDPIYPPHISPLVHPHGSRTQAGSPDRGGSTYVETTSISRRRPTGCAEYESLPRSERGLYCADVLLPEAVLQLHLLRAGRRSSAHLMTPEDEIKLYEEGLDLMRTEVHWVAQIVMLRQMAEKALKKGTKRKDAAPEIIFQGGTSSRPKMIEKKG